MVNIRAYIKLVVVPIAIVVLASCSKEERPEGIIPHDQMIPILIDVYISEGRVNSINLKRDSSLQLFEVVEEEIFKKHNVTDSSYRRSMIYYYDNPIEMEQIYEVVLDSLNLREQRMNAADKGDEEKSKEKESDK